MPTTIRQAAAEFLAGAEAGTIRNASRDRYKPSSVRTYERGLRLRVLPELGAAKVSELRRVDLQAFANRLLAAGADPSTISTTLMPLRGIYRLAEERGEVAVNPTAGVVLPRVRASATGSPTPTRRPG